MVKLGYEYITQNKYNEKKVIYKFLEDYGDSYLVKWWRVGEDKKRTSTWNKTGVKVHLEKGALKLNISESEQKIKENYNI